MSKIFIDGAGGNITFALVENGKLIEYQSEKKFSSVIVGSVYKGKVENVLPGMQAAFVNIGLEKNGYLNTGDILVDKNDIDGATTIPSVLELNVGDEIMVQVVKDASGSKGCRLTTNVSFAGRNLVYLPTLDIVGVSRKITDESLRKRYSEIAGSLKPEKGGFVVRTAAINASEKEIKDESEYLVKCYKGLLEAFKTAKAGEVLFEEGNLAVRSLRDVYNDEIDEIIVSERHLYEQIMGEAEKRGNGIESKVTFYDKAKDIFSEYNLTEEIDLMLRNKVYLETGAYINIDKTEALTAIDVNTGKYVGEDSLETTVFNTNVLAAKEIARQLRLRNIGGIIIVDFIDMEAEDHREKVIDELKKALLNDRTKCNVVSMTSLGLVEITRKKIRRESTARLVKKCPYCRGEGVIFSNDYIVMKIRIALIDLFAQGYKSAIIDVNAEIADYVFKYGSLSQDVAKIWNDKRIYLVPHKTYHQEFFLVKGDNSTVLDLPDKARQLF
ncbi:MAG: Rne/Rng family ribonuclease [Christensenellaceae bacterium]